MKDDPGAIIAFPDGTFGSSSCRHNKSAKDAAQVIIAGRNSEFLDSGLRRYDGTG
jgi:hypothetical protein